MKIVQVQNLEDLKDYKLLKKKKRCLSLCYKKIKICGNLWLLEIYVLNFTPELKIEAHCRCSRNSLQWIKTPNAIPVNPIKSFQVTHQIEKKKKREVTDQRELLSHLNGTKGENPKSITAEGPRGKTAMQMQMTCNVHCQLLYYYLSNVSTAMDKSHLNLTASLSSRVERILYPEQMVS